MARIDFLTKNVRNRCTRFGTTERSKRRQDTRNEKRTRRFFFFRRKRETCDFGGNGLCPLCDVHGGPYVSFKTGSSRFRTASRRLDKLQTKRGFFPPMLNRTSSIRPFYLYIIEGVVNEFSFYLFGRKKNNTYFQRIDFQYFSRLSYKVGLGGLDQIALKKKIQ